MSSGTHVLPPESVSNLTCHDRSRDPQGRSPGRIRYVTVDCEPSPAVSAPRRDPKSSPDRTRAHVFGNLSTLGHLFGEQEILASPMQYHMLRRLGECHPRP